MEEKISLIKLNSPKNIISKNDKPFGYIDGQSLLSSYSLSSSNVEIDQNFCVGEKIIDL